ncbi:expressed unknown protein [Seminavis robusta]|uniref:Uncharacterized protein n=1 Tax=Seminavis robusta TaxID=568900 RepID=A0A9N8EPP3_9STRA|nr:expressed unknown protein [Seminavis robusta]|eukprot:Sro1301_g260830.1 n/a (569) ;mRNA; f:20360-22415
MNRRSTSAALYEGDGGHQWDDATEHSSRFNSGGSVHDAAHPPLRREPSGINVGMDKSRYSPREPSRTDGWMRKDPYHRPKYESDDDWTPETGSMSNSSSSLSPSMRRCTSGSTSCTDFSNSVLYDDPLERGYLVDDGRRHDKYTGLGVRSDGAYHQRHYPRGDVRSMEGRDMSRDRPYHLPHPDAQLRRHSDFDARYHTNYSPRQDHHGGGYYPDERPPPATRRQSYAGNGSYGHVSDERRMAHSVRGYEDDDYRFGRDEGYGDDRSYYSESHVPRNYRTGHQRRHQDSYDHRHRAVEDDGYYYNERGYHSQHFSYDHDHDSDYGRVEEERMCRTDVHYGSRRRTEQRPPEQPAPYENGRLVSGSGLSSRYEARRQSRRRELLEQHHHPRSRRDQGSDADVLSSSSHRSCDTRGHESTRSSKQPPRLPPRLLSGIDENMPRLKDDTKYLTDEEGTRKSSGMKDDDDAIVMVDISPGVRARLRRVNETKKAVARDFYTSVSCLACARDLFCISDVNWFICPGCKVISRLDEPPRDGSSQHGLGMGFSVDALMTMQSEVHSKRRGSHSRR